MPKYVTIGYGDQAGYEKTPEALRSAAHAQDKKLQDEGAVMGIAGTPLQVRNTCGAEVKTETGASCLLGYQSRVSHHRGRRY
jgi:hypothetical protein